MKRLVASICLFFIVVSPGFAEGSEMSLKSFDTKIVRSNSVYTVVSWKTTIKSKTNQRIKIKVLCLDKDKFIVDSTIEYKKITRGASTFRDTFMVYNEDMANIKTFSIKVKY